MRYEPANVLNGNYKYWKLLFFVNIT